MHLLTRLLRVAPLAGITLLVAACTASQPAPAPATVGSSGPVQPKVNRVVMAVVPPAMETNESRLVGQPDAWQLRPMYEYLIGVDVDSGKLIPQLATSWKLEADGRAFRFPLRPGVAFHNDLGEFTAKDVGAVWKDTSKEDTLNQFGPYFRRTVRSIDASNDHEVVFGLAVTDGNFLSASSQQESGLEMRSAADMAQRGPGTMLTSPTAGTGPYQFKERSQGSYVRYSRTPYQHWRITPDFPEFEFRWMKEASTRLASLISGEVHLAGLPQDLSDQASKQGFTNVRGRAPGFRAFFSLYCCFLNAPLDSSKGMMFPDSPLMDVRVRQALNKAVDRDAVNKAFFAGKGQVMYNTHFHPSRPGWNPAWETQFAAQYGYDPEKARDLLAQAGYGPSRPLTTSMFLGAAAGISGAEDIEEAVAGYFRSVGATVNLVTVDPTEKSNGRRGYRFSNHLDLIGTSSNLLLGSMVYNSGLMSPLTGASDPEVNEVLKVLAQTLDEEKQSDLWRKAGDLMYGKFLNVPLFWVQASIETNPRIVGDFPWPGSISGTWTHVENIKASR